MSLVSQLHKWLKEKEGRESGMVRYYDIIYRTTSAAVHSTAMSLANFVKKTSDRSYIFNTAGSSEGQAVFHLLYNDLFELGNIARHNLSLDLDDAFDQEMEKHGAFLAAQSVAE
ncbi:MAG: hypothetical protein FJ246_11605 [Nitrospira sp.]|nr:hypothetical protein [Nitrospira sp.]